MEDKTKLSTPVIILAVVVLIGYFVMLGLMYTQVVTAEPQTWERLVFLYGGVQAVAFAAAGYLFGKEVHRQQAEQAEQRADEVTKEASAKTAEASAANAKGESLAKAIAAKLNSSASTSVGYGPLGKGDARAVESLATRDLDELGKLARELFPAATQ